MNQTNAPRPAADNLPDGVVIPAHIQDGDAVAAEVLRNGGTVTLTFGSGEYGRGGHLPTFGADALSRDGEYLAVGCSVMSPADALASLEMVARRSNETLVHADSVGWTALGGPVGARVDICAVLEEGGSLTVVHNPGGYAATVRDVDGVEVAWGRGDTPTEALGRIHGSWGSGEIDCSDEPPF